MYCDIALEEEEMYTLINYVMEFERVYLDQWLKMDIDADKIKAAGKKVFFHNDGYIMDLYPEFIQLGVDAINSQLWCMGVEKVAEKYAGKMTFWGEISRQDTLPNGSPEDVRRCAEIMKNIYIKMAG